MFNNQYMKRALELAQKASLNGEVPVGAIIVERNSNIIVAESYNEVEKQSNPLAHAEMIAIAQSYYKLKNKFLSDCDIYVTLEPCSMCSAAISYARISRLYFGALDSKFGAIESGPKIFSANSSYYKPEIYSGILSNESAVLLKDFFLKLRKN